MSYSIRKNWIASFELILTKPIVLLPFLIIAFIEGLALELIYFSTRKPLSIVAVPIIRKFFGANSVHYPGNLYILTDLFYYAEMIIYVFISIFLIAISINIFKNIRMNLPIKTAALIKNASRQYLSFVIFGIIMMVFITLLRYSDRFIFSKLLPLGLKYLPKIGIGIYLIVMILFLFLSNIILQIFLLLAIPIMVIEKRPLLKALGGSIYLGFRNFFKIFSLIFLPFLIYAPISLLKIASTKLAAKTFPEITFYIAGAGIIIAALIDCFIVVCASQFLLDKEGVER